MSWTYFLLLGFGIPGFLVGRVLSGDPWLGLEPGILLVFGFLGFTVGAVIGNAKGRFWQASWLGLALGPLGWIIASALPDRRESRASVEGPSAEISE